MTNTATTPSSKKPNSKLFIIIVLILSALSLDYYKFHFVLGTDVTIADSTIVVSPTIDTISNVISDTTKSDTTKK